MAFIDNIYNIFPMNPTLCYYTPETQKRQVVLGIFFRCGKVTTNLALIYLLNYFPLQNLIVKLMPLF